MKKILPTESGELDQIIDRYCEWFGAVQAIISFNSFKNEDGTNKTFIGWIFTLLYSYLASWSEPNKKDDGVMSIAWTFGTLLIGWAARTQLAKCYDPRRSLKSRKEGLESWRKNKKILMQFLTPAPTEADKNLYDQDWSKPE
jgi:hypothetical protein